MAQNQEQAVMDLEVYNILRGPKMDVPYRVREV